MGTYLYINRLSSKLAVGSVSFFLTNNIEYVANLFCYFVLVLQAAKVSYNRG
ncbi:hypothetical protein C427_1945 [Paraglaciecola psychrophila 170]|uniref:Uncharacterized protein n=1 Tax=Paraglaciecola psychrophila 170 TaxID=1129794 RepID=M4RPD1_9ALTE|nr:hypothetical protein C427_1945 [Paraglaciecola psychrophila 170]